MNISRVREPFATLPDWPLQTTAKILREARDLFTSHRDAEGKSEDYMFKSNNEVLFLNQNSCSSVRLPDNMRSGGLCECNLCLTPLISQNSGCDLLMYQHRLLQTNILVPCGEITAQFSLQKAHVEFQVRNEFSHMNHKPHTKQFVKRAAV